MTSCYGGQAADVAGVLPKGSHLVTLAPGSAEVQEQDVGRFISSLGSGSDHNLSAQGMLNLYLIYGMENRVTPSMAIAGNGSYDLRGAMLSHLGKPFSDSEKTSIYDKLGTTMPREQIDATMKKVASAKSEWDISAKEYGPVLAIMMATSQPTTNPITSDNDGTRQRSPQMLEKTTNIRPLQLDNNASLSYECRRAI